MSQRVHQHVFPETSSIACQTTELYECQWATLKTAQLDVLKLQLKVGAGWVGVVERRDSAHHADAHVPRLHQQAAQEAKRRQIEAHEEALLRKIEQARERIEGLMADKKAMTTRLADAEQALRVSRKAAKDLDKQLKSKEEATTKDSASPNGSKASKSAQEVRARSTFAKVVRARMAVDKMKSRRVYVVCMCVGVRHTHKELTPRLHTCG